MDLQTIREKLQGGHYATPSDFSKDVCLIFENSAIYYTDRNSYDSHTDWSTRPYLKNISKTFCLLMEIGKLQLKVNLKRMVGSLSVSNIFCCFFLGKSKIPTLNETKSKNGKSLAPTNSNHIQTAFGFQQQKWRWRRVTGKRKEKFCSLQGSCSFPWRFRRR